jgi:hypothetical protein
MADDNPKWRETRRGYSSGGKLYTAIKKEKSIKGAGLQTIHTVNDMYSLVSARLRITI